jgi:signal transduction histidine kinase
LLLAAMPPGSAEVRAATPKRALLIYSHEREMGMYASFDRALRTRLQSNAVTPVEFYTEYLDLMRFGDPEYRQTSVDYLRVKYDELRIDVIVGVGSLAFDFLQEYGDAIFPDVPIVFTSVNASVVAATTLNRNVTGVGVKRDVRQTVDLLLALHPDTRQIVIPAGSSPIEEAWTASTREQLGSYGKRVSLTFLSGLPMEAMVRKLRDLPEHSIVLFTTLFFHDGAGQYFLPEEALATIAAAANAPVYGTDEAFLGSGIVGGILYDLAPAGDAAGRLAKRVLIGEKPADIPVETIDPNYPIFDNRQLKRWSVPKSRLPAGSLVRFEEPGPWDQYKGYIIGVVSLLTVQAALIAGLIASHSKQRRAEASLRASHEQVRDLARRLIAAQEEERTRIARELHDDAGQRMASMSIDLSLIEREVVDDPRHASQVLAEVHREMDTLSDDLRDLSHSLHPGVLEHLGLIKSLDIRCKEVAVESGIAVRFDVEHEIGSVPAAIGLCLYRVAQEAIRNIVKHAAARSARVSLARHNGHIALTVEDDGCGFDAGPTNGQRGLGLMSLDERVRMLGGTFAIATSPNKGTTVSVTIPL